MTDEMEVKIGDFGLAVHTFESNEVNGKIAGGSKNFQIVKRSRSLTKGVGTPTYASPEQLKETFYQHASDIFSMGIIIFEMFYIFKTRSERAIVLEKLRNGDFPESMISKYPDIVSF